MISKSNIDLYESTRVPVGQVSKSATNLGRDVEVQAYYFKKKKKASEKKDDEEGSKEKVEAPKPFIPKSVPCGFIVKTPEEERAYEKLVKVQARNKQLASAWKTTWLTIRMIVAFATHVMIMLFWIWVMKSLLEVGGSGSSAKQKRHGVIERNQGNDNVYFLTEIFAQELSMDVTIEGPFFTEAIQNKEYNEAALSRKKQQVFKCSVERWIFPANKELVPSNTKIRQGGYPTAMGRIVMNNYSMTSHREPLDYNNYPRTVRISIPGPDSPVEEGDVIRYALGFAKYKEQKKPIPFNFEFSFDIIPMRTRIFVGVIPAAIMGALPLLNINPGAAAYVGCAAGSSVAVKTGITITSLTDFILIVDSGFVIHVFATMLCVSLLVETRVYSFLAYQFLKVTGGFFLAPIILINCLAYFLSIYINNILIALLLVPLTIRLMEIMQLHPQALLMNMTMMCNIGGRTYTGTVSNRLVFVHPEGINNGVTMSNFYLMMFPCTFKCALATFIYFFLIYMFIKPQALKKRPETTQNDHILLLCNRASIAVFNVSRNWHVVKAKMRDLTEALKQDLETQRYRNEETDESWQAKLRVAAPECTIHNYFLLVKSVVTITCFLLLLTIYFYLYSDKNKFYFRYDELRLGFIGIFTVLLVLFLNHARDLDLLLKRIDWQTLLVVLAVGAIGNIFNLMAQKMDDYVWKLYGATMEGSHSAKVLKFGAQVLSYSSMTTLFNEHLVVVEMLDTILTFAKGAGFGAIKEILCGFYLATGAVWANASVVASLPNLVTVGAAEQQGYRIWFFQFMLYGIPISLVNFLILFLDLYSFI